MTTRDQLIAAAHKFLPPSAVEPWISLLRPGIQLKPASGDDPVVAHFGGDPLMHPDEPWPEVPYAVLSHLLTIDLARFPGAGLDLPTAGLLTFFAVSSGEMAGAVRYYPSTAELVVCQGPEEAREFPFERVALTAVERWTVPDPNHPYLRHVQDLIDIHEEENWPEEGTPEYDVFMDTPPVFENEEYLDATTPSSPSHLIGGYGRDVQYSADFAPTAKPVAVPTENGLVEDTELRVLLAQIDSDRTGDIQWGDFGTALWTISREDLAARRFENAEHFWNCH